MNTIEIITNFMKGATKAGISDKQRNWLLGQAKKEGIPVIDRGYGTGVYFDDCFYTIRQAKTLASGGSYVGTRYINGRYVIEKLLTIKFDNGNTFVYGVHDVDHFRREGKHQFEIIKPHIPQ